MAPPNEIYDVRAFETSIDDTTVLSHPKCFSHSAVCRVCGAKETVADGKWERYGARFGPKIFWQDFKITFCKHRTFPFRLNQTRGSNYRNNGPNSLIKINERRMRFESFLIGSNFIIIKEKHASLTKMIFVLFNLKIMSVSIINTPLCPSCDFFIPFLLAFWSFLLSALRLNQNFRRKTIRIHAIRSKDK